MLGRGERVEPVGENPRFWQHCPVHQLRCYGNKHSLIERLRFKSQQSPMEMTTETVLNRINLPTASISSSRLKSFARN